MLHGRGADEEDLLGLSEYLDPRFLIMNARAPFPFPFGGGYTWYDFAAVGTPDPSMFKTSYEKLAQFVDDALRHYPVDRNNVYLLGFSMGTVMSYALALTTPELVRGVVANSGYVPEGTHLVYRWSELGSVDFLITHGIHDPVIPIEFGRRSRDILSRSTANVTYNEYPMGHQISEESLGEVAGWLRNRLDNQS